MELRSCFRHSRLVVVKVVLSCFSRVASLIKSVSTSSATISYLMDDRKTWTRTATSKSFKLHFTLQPMFPAPCHSQIACNQLRLPVKCPSTLTGKVSILKNLACKECHCRFSGHPRAYFHSDPNMCDSRPCVLTSPPQLIDFIKLPGRTAV